MTDYYIVSPSGFLCVWNRDAQKFEETAARSLSELSTEAERRSVTHVTSMNGTISRIPAGYTVQVPNLPVGVQFRVEENAGSIPPGYRLLGYERDQDSFYNSDDGDTFNSGRVRARESPAMTVNNQRGWELQAKKQWSDADYADWHAPIYTAVYLDGSPVAGTVRQIEHPALSVNYYFEDLAEGHTFSEYEIREVSLVNPTVAADGTVTAYDGINPAENGVGISAEARYHGMDTEQNISYLVEYEKGTVTGGGSNVRTDTVINTPEDALVIRLFEWDSTVPLANGTFTLTLDGEPVGAESYTSDEEGRITILCNPEKGGTYVLEQTAAPQGYIGLQQPVTFTVAANRSVTINNPNGTGWADPFKPDPEGKLIGYIDLHNQPYTLRAVKQDAKTGTPLAGVHFALYRSVKDSSGEWIRDMVPLRNYEDLVTDENGVVQGLGTLAAGTYYLKETQATGIYRLLAEDIRFTVLKLGNVTLDPHEDAVLSDEETEDGRVITITIDNKERDVKLTVTKSVRGILGSKAEDFTFTLTVQGAEPDAVFPWTKNGVRQTVPLRSGSTFTLHDAENAVILLPSRIVATVSEESAGYHTYMQIGSGEQEEVSSKAVILLKDTALHVTNTRSGILPTGLLRTHTLVLVLSGILLCGMILYLRRRTAASDRK